MGHQKQNGRNVGVPDENRPSWRPRDQVAYDRGGDEERDHDQREREREREREEDERFVGDRGRWSSGRDARWSDPRDEGYRMSERFGQGQSGYTAGREGDDPSMGLLGRNQSYPRGDEDRPHRQELDERFAGRGGQGYWQDRGSLHERSAGRGDDRERGGPRADRGFGGAEHRGYVSGYNQGGQGGSRHGAQRGQVGGQQGFGGYGHVDEPRVHEPGARGYGQGRSGGYAPQPGASGGRSGQFGQGHQGHDQPGGGGPGEPRGGHRGKAPVGYQRSDDRIREHVCEALTDDDLVDASAIEVAVKSGEVTLSGTVPDRRTKRLAEDVVERCPGVKDVLNQLRVSGGGERPSVGSQDAESPGARSCAERGEEAPRLTRMFGDDIAHATEAGAVWPGRTSDGVLPGLFRHMRCTASR